MRWQSVGVGSLVSFTQAASHCLDASRLGGAVMERKYLPGQWAHCEMSACLDAMQSSLLPPTSGWQDPRFNHA